jgi:hypothetical protein
LMGAEEVSKSQMHESHGRRGTTLPGVTR